MLTSLYSLFYVTGEFHRFLHQGRAQFTHRGSFERPFSDKDDSDRGITTVSEKEIQARNEARIPQNIKRATSWSTRVWMSGLQSETRYQ